MSFLTDENKFDDVTFSIKVTMRRRWVSHFLAMLKHMQQLGGWGSTRLVSFVSDGDGDFRPKFEWDAFLPFDAEPIEDKDGDKTFDAG